MNEIMINIAYNAYFSLSRLSFGVSDDRKKQAEKNLLALPRNKTRTFLFLGYIYAISLLPTCCLRRATDLSYISIYPSVNDYIQYIQARSMIMKK